MMVYILKNIDIYIKCLKWNLLQNDNSKPVDGGTKSPVSDERVHGRLLLSFIYISIQKKNNLLTSDIYYVWKGIDF